MAKAIIYLVVFTALGVFYYLVSKAYNVREMISVVLYLLVADVLLNLYILIRSKDWCSFLRLAKITLVKISLLVFVLPVLLVIDNVFKTNITNLTLVFPLLYEAFEVDKCLKKLGINILELVHKLGGEVKKYSKEIKEIKENL